MERNEKGHFLKQHSGIRSKRGTTYLKLYHTLEKMKKPDDGKLLSMIPELAHAQLSNQKAYLYDQILLSLERYHSESSDAKLRRLLSDIRILHTKGLLIQCENLIKKAEKLSIKTERYLHLSEIQAWKYSLLVGGKDTDKVRKDLLPVLSVSRSALHEYLLLLDYRQAQSETLVESWSDRSVRGTAGKQKLAEIEKKIQSLPMPASISAKLFRSNALTVLADLRGETKEAIRERRECVHLLESRPDLIRDEPPRYLVSVYNLATYLYNSKYYKEAETELIKLIGIAKKQIKQYVPRRYYLIGVMMRLITEIKLRGIKTSMSSITEAEYVIEKFGKDFTGHDRLLVYYHLSWSYFNLEQFDRSLPWINKVINEQGAEKTNPAIYLLARLTTVLIHFELKNTEYMEYLIRSLYRFLKTRKRLYRFEELLMEFIRIKLPKVNSPKELLLALTDLRKQVKVLQNDPFESSVFENFDFPGWLDGKLKLRD